MIRVEVAPGLILDEEMYGLAHEALSRIAPEQIPWFTWERFISYISWIRIPDPEHPGTWYKAEFTIKGGAPWLQLVRLNVWRSADLRKTGEPMPHSHPWPFVGNLLLGGYEEVRYEVANSDGLLANPYEEWNIGGVGLVQNVMHQAGDTNSLALRTFHEVTRILEPGRTMSMMNCGQGRKNGWGYLDLDKGLYVPKLMSPPDELFSSLLLDLNPHLTR